MTEEGLIELYNNSTLSGLQLFLIGLGVLSIGLIILITFVYIDHRLDLKYILSFMGLGLILFSTIFGVVSIPSTINNIIHGDDKEHFEQVFKNYLDEHKETHEIVYIKVSTNEEINSNYYSITSNPSTIYTVTYKDGDKLITDVFNVETHMSLSKDETPYLEYTPINKSINSVYGEGKYDATIYLPKGYKFDTIK